MKCLECIRVQEKRAKENKIPYCLPACIDVNEGLCCEHDTRKPPLLNWCSKCKEWDEFRAEHFAAIKGIDL